MEELSARTRAANLEAMERTTLDVLVIGGGIVGAWIALTAALRGHRTGLVEKGDFASGTSGKTSRLIHGGLRYLQQFRIGIVRQAARERDVLLRIAPRLVKPLTFLIPVYRRRGPKGWQLRFGLWLYDALSREKVLPGRRWVSRDEALQVEPRLDPNGLVRAALYSDAYAHDARLVMEVVRPPRRRAPSSRTMRGSHSYCGSRRRGPCPPWTRPVGFLARRSSSVNGQRSGARGSRTSRRDGRLTCGPRRS